MSFDCFFTLLVVAQAMARIFMSGAEQRKNVRAQKKKERKKEGQEGLVYVPGSR
jgi:hypothetical protein